MTGQRDQEVGNNVPHPHQGEQGDVVGLLISEGLNVDWPLQDLLFCSETLSNLLIGTPRTKESAVDLVLLHNI